jgi:HlyD family secretion protein
MTLHSSTPMKRPILVLAIVLVVFVAFVGTLYFLYQKSREKPVVHETDQPLVTDIVSKTVATGAIIPRHEIEIKPRVSGVVSELAVEPGQYVKRNDLIARIQIIPDVVTVHRAEADVQSARLALDNARREFERHQRLFEQQVISEAELSRMRHDFEVRRQDLAAAQNNLQLVREGASRKAGQVSNEVRSTVEGMILDVPVKEGESVTETNNFNPGTTIAYVADMNDMIFEGRVDESEVGKIKEGMELELKIGAIDDLRFKGRLEYIAPKGFDDEGTIQFAIRAAMEPLEGVFIRAGYSANADIVLDRREQVLAVRESTLAFERGKPYVEVEVAPQVFERREVTLGLSDGIHIEVLSGIDAGVVLKQQGLRGGGPRGGGPGGRGGRGR